MKISIKDYCNIPKEQHNGIYEVENYGILYYVNGKLHREDGPAEELLEGTKCWYINGELHRLDGPAVEYAVWLPNERYKNEYLIQNKRYSTKEEFEAAAYMYKNGLQYYL